LFLAISITPLSTAFAAESVSPIAATSASALKKPAKPTGIKASATAHNKIKVSWKKAARAETYIIYRLEGGAYKKVGTTKKTSYTASGLLRGTQYSFKVAARNAKGTSPMSSAASAWTNAVAAPTGLTAAANKKNPSTQINLKWRSVSGATSYTIYRSSDHGKTYSKLGTSKSNSYVAKNLKQETVYHFKVAATTFEGTSARGAAASAATCGPTGCPVPPGGTSSPR